MPIIQGVSALNKNPNRDMQEGIESSAKEGADALTQYLKGRMQKKNLETAQQFVDENAKSGRKVNIGLGAEGGVTIGQADQDPLGSAVKREQLAALAEERKNRHVERLSDKVSKSGLPGMEASLSRVEKAIPGITTGVDPATGQTPKIPLSARALTSGIGSYVADPLVSAGEALGVLPKGSSEQRAALQAIANQELRNNAGTAQTAAETTNTKRGMGISSLFSDAPIVEGIGAIQKKANNMQQEITAGAPRDALAEYMRRGGTGDLDSWKKAKAPAAGPDRSAIAAERARRAAAKKGQ